MQALAYRSMSVVLWIVCLVLAVASARAKFTVVALPDTQRYSENLKPGEDPNLEVTQEYADGLASIFFAQTQWIADNVESRNIRFVCHLGDIVEHGPNLEEWEIAHAAMQILDDADVPYGTCLGNHDNHYGYGNAWDMDPNAPEYISYFTPERFAGDVWYHGVSPTMRSNYQMITAEGRKLLFLNISIDTPQRELDWAQRVLDENPDRLVVLCTHRYLYDFRILQGRYGDGVIGHEGFEESVLADEQYDPETVWPTELFESFIRTNRNIFLVLCGHCHGQYHQISENDWGLPVLEVLTDYQSGLNGGDGWLRIMEFDFDAGTIDFSTYSPTLDRQRTIVDDFMETFYIVSRYRDDLAEVMDLSAFETLMLLAELTADLPDVTKDPALEDYLAQPEVQAYLESLGMDYAWDGLWVRSFADGSRDPAFTLALDFDAYAAPDPEPADGEASAQTQE